MAIKRPDIYEHNNPLNAIVDSDFVRGGIRTSVANLNQLYQIGSGINDKTDQLKEYATKVYVSGENKFYILKDLNNRTNISGWIPESVGDLDLSGYATNIDLQNTGQNLNQKINLLSGNFEEENILVFTAELPSGEETAFLTYPFSISSSPSSITCSFQNTIDNVIYTYTLGQITQSGFYANFSDILSNSGYLLKVKVKI